MQSKEGGSVKQEISQTILNALFDNIKEEKRQVAVQQSAIDDLDEKTDELKDQIQ